MQLCDRVWRSAAASGASDQQFRLGAGKITRTFVGVADLGLVSAALAGILLALLGDLTCVVHTLWFRDQARCLPMG